MREAARALDDVSDHLGEVLRRADELLAEWSQFGAQVRTQVEREAAAIGEVVDGAVARAASSGIDRAIVDRLRALTAELERLEQRTRAASRTVVEHREADRRVLWVVVAGIVLANALLVVLVLRKPDPAPVAEPVRIESTAPVPSQPPPVEGAAPAGGSADATSAMNAGSAMEAERRLSVPSAGPNAPSTGPNAPSTGPNAPSTGPNAPSTGIAGASAPSAPSAGSGAPSAGSNAAGATSGSNTPASASASAPAKAAPPRGGSATLPGAPAGSTKRTLSPIVLPPKSGNARTHKKLP